MKTCCLYLTALFCLAGCAGKPDLIMVDLPLEDDWPPPKPFVTLAEVVERDGHVFWKESGKPFTGTLVTYDSYALFVESYHDGSVVPCYGPPPDMIDVMDVVPENVYDEALHYYLARKGPGHNEYLYLIHNGRESDIPMLLAGLRSCPVRKSGAMVCTQKHCVDALRAITGADPGYTYSAWATWWKEKYGTDVPDWKPLDK